MHEYVTEKNFWTLNTKEHTYTMSTDLFQKNKRILWLFWVDKIYSEIMQPYLYCIFVPSMIVCITLVGNNTWDFKI